MVAQSTAPISQAHREGSQAANEINQGGSQTLPYGTFG
jgi:hypothetical protein